MTEEKLSGQGELIETAPQPTPLPKMQLAILLLAQMPEQLTASVIYPFVNQLVRSTGITGGDERKTGYYAGLIESLYYAIEAITILQWGRVSDHIGRKPVILVGLFGVTLSIVSFGFSKEFWMLILSRCAQGALNGNLGVVKCNMTEITDTSNMAQAFAWLPFAWAAGYTLGFLIGGVLSDPAAKWPDTVGRYLLFHRYPYFLPCIVAASVAIASWLITLLFLKESMRGAASRTQSLSHIDDTKKSIMQAAKIHDKPADTQVDILPRMLDEAETANPASSSLGSSRTDFRSILIPRVMIPVLHYGLLCFVDQCMLVLMPLMYSTSRPLGGLGFSSNTIGLVMSAWSMLNGTIQVYSFPRLLRRFGPMRLYITSFSFFLITFSAYPLMGYMAKHHMEAAMWLILCVQLVAYTIAYSTYSCIILYINNGAPSKDLLGATNGLAQTMASMMRAVGPTAVSSLFALSLEKNLAGGTAVYWIMCTIVILVLGFSTYLPKSLT
ncbi:major facilitator superfamily domain-containing protein [Suillus clintonianus]|uniref:major facilitator superfamily domain-containing protein n=1 Tax=Suillus clintonianus TaxID=1904413 RepID=UPI001B86C8EA|nr:major facilitator superfamily domain-containing protein [Suillus clintonianus]KAG2122761.1 major facilitator superfamily domain-containing protein [Suillus clintonianus]